jgi:hypothetical protein
MEFVARLMDKSNNLIITVWLVKADVISGTIRKVFVQSVDFIERYLFYCIFS